MNPPLAVRSAVRAALGAAAAIAALGSIALVWLRATYFPDLTWQRTLVGIGGGLVVGMLTAKAGTAAAYWRYRQVTDTPTAPPRFSCPRCGRSSSHRQDLALGYCGACHDFTGTPQP